MSDTNLEQPKIPEQDVSDVKPPETNRNTEQHEQPRTTETKPTVERPKDNPKTETEKPRLRLPSFKKTPKIINTTKDAITIRVENIMQEGLADAYQKLSPIAQQEFKIKGEETAGAIRELLKSAHVKAKKIFHLIYNWLRLLPGVNRFFLEQEAKIKTDKIIMAKKEDDQMKIERI